MIIDQDSNNPSRVMNKTKYPKRVAVEAEEAGYAERHGDVRACARYGSLSVFLFGKIGLAHLYIQEARGWQNASLTWSIRPVEGGLQAVVAGTYRRIDRSNWRRYITSITNWSPYCTAHTIFCF